MYYNFFIHSSTDGHLGCFQILAIAYSNNAAINIGVHVFFFVLVFWDPCGIFPEVESWGQKGARILIFKGYSILFSTVAAPDCILTNSTLGFPFLQILPNVCCLLIY